MLYDNFTFSTFCKKNIYMFSIIVPFIVNQDKLSDVKNMNWCKFIADFIHDAFAKKMYQKGSRLYLMASLLVDCFHLCYLSLSLHFLLYFYLDTHFTFPKTCFICGVAYVC